MGFFSGAIQETGNLGLLLARTLRTVLAAHAGESVVFFINDDNDPLLLLLP